MFDLGMTELLIIGVVALIVIGPKDLPVLFRKVGQFTGRLRAMSREFSNAMNEAADQSGMKDVTKTLKTATNPLGSAMDEVKKQYGTTMDSLKDIDPESETGKMSARRAEQTAKIKAATARKAADQKAKEAAAALKAAEEAEAAQAALQKGSE